MTIASELTKLQTNLTNAYTSCNNKGATMPSSQNFDNLATTINSIQTGGGGGVTPTGTIEITENGTYDVTNYASAEVAVEGSGGGGSDSVPMVCPYVDAIILTTNEWGKYLPEKAFKGAFKNIQSKRFGIFDNDNLRYSGINSLWDYSNINNTTINISSNGLFMAYRSEFQEAFKGNKSVTTVAFAAFCDMWSTALLDCFVDSVVQTIYINTNVYLGGLTGYDNKWGAPTATIITLGYEED